MDCGSDMIPMKGERVWKAYVKVWHNLIKHKWFNFQEYFMLHKMFHAVTILDMLTLQEFPLLEVEINRL